MGTKKEQTLLNRFRLEERLFENTLKSLQQNVLDNQPVPVLGALLRNLSHRHQQLTNVTQQLTGFLANDALETLFDSMPRVASEFENAELRVSLKKKQTIIDYQPEAAVPPAACFNNTSVTNILTSYRYHLH